MTGPAIASRVVGTIRMTAESHRGRVVRKNVMIALSSQRLVCRRLASACAARAGLKDAGTRPRAVTLRAGRPSGLRDRCALVENELPAPVLPNEHAGAATLLIHLPVLVLSLGGGTTGYDGGIAVGAPFDLARHERLETHARGFAVLEVLRPFLAHA